jgi:hypothetical protein
METLLVVEDESLSVSKHHGVAVNVAELMAVPPAAVMGVTA